MSIEHLHYILKEIDITAQILSIKNSSFFKRSMARLIAVRMDDYIKLGFSINKQADNKQIIKDELNALKDLYTDNFKLQRDKYGAHFQHLDFGQRLQNWSDINVDKADFFTQMPTQLYNHFDTVAGYVGYTSIALSPNAKTIIENINDDFDFEQYPTLATDILSLTRPNSGGVLNFNMIHTKAGVLKSLELFIEYERAMIEKLVLENQTSATPFVKLFIIDLLSYVDNFFTRSDIPSTSPQYEEGFDHYVATHVDDGTKDGNEIISQFKTNFKLEEHVSELRLIRNKACGHIDTTLTVVQLETLIVEFNLNKFYEFYERLKSILRSVCYSTIYLKQYLIDPSERIHGVDRMVGMEVSSFDGAPFPEPPSRFKSSNDIIIYEQQYLEWLSTKSGEARSYFWDCFINSDIIESVQIEIEGLSGNIAGFRYRDFRKAHSFFERKLSSDTTTRDDKVAIIDLFIQCQSGDPEVLGYILDKTYPDNKDSALQASYFRAIGRLSRQRSEKTLQQGIHFFNNTNLEGKCVALGALFNIDLSARRNTVGKHNSDNSAYSEHIKSILNSDTQPFQTLSLSLVLLSDYAFGRHYLSDSLEKFYREFLLARIMQSTNRMFRSSLVTQADKQKLTETLSTIGLNRFATFIGLLSQLMEENDFPKEARAIRILMIQEYIKFAQHDNQEVHNLAVILVKTGDIDGAIKIARFLIQKNAHQVDGYYLLLDLFRQDKKYKSEFDETKSKVITTFNLSDQERQELENITLNDETD